jgi:ABC-2 type transport system ATP-binding protein
LASLAEAPRHGSRLQRRRQADDPRPAEAHPTARTPQPTPLEHTPENGVPSGMLEARQLTKYYGAIAAVRDVSFQVAPGRILGYLGPNGSGKSTTVKMLTGLLPPTSGAVLLDGEPIADRLIGYKAMIGYVPEEAHLYTYLTGPEYLSLVGRLRGLPGQLVDDKIAAFLRLFGLENARYAAISSYSKGMRQKILISAALLHNPRIVIFDEPCSGLDVTSTLVLRSLARELAREGRIVLYSSHVLEMVEAICSDVVILHEGRVVAHDDVARLRDLTRLPSIEAVFRKLVVTTDVDRVAEDLIGAMKL